MTLELPALRGTNPLGLFAALGALDVATRGVGADAPPPRLWWSDDLEPEARLEGVDSIVTLIEFIDADRSTWVGSPLLDHEVDGEVIMDVKLSTKDPKRDDRNLLREWINRVHRDGSSTDVAMLHAFVAEGSTMGSSADAKPTHFHFTAGQQRFLQMIRDLRDGVTSEHLTEALVGPWRFESPLPMLGWDTSRGDRIYALRGFDPAGQKKLGVPGAEWLGFLGLRFFPVATRFVNGRAQLMTTGCDANWKRGAFTWPIWGVGRTDTRPGLPAAVVQSLVADEALCDLADQERAELGVTRVLRAPITRSDQGGYGSFGPPAEVVSRRDQLSAMVL